MSASLSVNGTMVPGACARILLQGLVSREIPLEDLDPRIPATMERKGFATIEATCLRISPRGLELAKALQAKGWEPEPLKRKKRAATTDTKSHSEANGKRSTPRGAANNRATKRSNPDGVGAERTAASTAESAPAPSGGARTKRESPPPTGVVDFDALRARIVEHYEADLAACDRMREIAERVGA